MKKQKSFTGSLTIIMVVLLAIAFSAANFISTRYWMKVVVGESSKSMSEVRAQYGSAVIQVSLLSTVMGIIVIFIILILMRKIVINPVKLCCKEIENLANFDLRENADTKKLEQLGKFNHELGTIARSLLILKTNFTSLGSKISDTSTQLKINASGLAEKTVFVMDSSDEIEKAMDTVNRGAMDQAEDTTNGVGIVEDLSERINKTIEDTKSLSDSSDKIDSIKDEGMSVINELIRKTNETNVAVGLVKDALFKNSEQAKKIEEASKLINGIASQTNLLSLNASIEAARAGEAGRGFAVVAGEIGSLADETNKLTSEIEQIIADLLDKTNEAANNMVDMENSFKSQEESVNITKEKFNDIESAVGDIKYRVDLLSKSSEFMIESRDSLQVLMGELTSKAQSNAAAAEEVTAAVDTQTDVIQDITGISQELAAIAEELENETHQFII